MGAISILFLFVIMKTEAGRSPRIAINPKIKGVPLDKTLRKSQVGLRYDLIIFLTL